MLSPCRLLRHTADSNQVSTWDRECPKIPESSKCVAGQDVGSSAFENVQSGLS